MGAGGAGAARDGDLRAGEIELGAADGARAVQGDVLGAEEVVAVLDARRDGDGHARGTCLVWFGLVWFGLVSRRRRGPRGKYLIQTHPARTTSVRSR